MSNKYARWFVALIYIKEKVNSLTKRTEFIIYAFE